MKDILASICPFPYVIDASTVCDGLMFSQPKPCLRCHDRSCISAPQSPSTHIFSVCHRGVSVVTVPTPGGHIVFNGLHIKEHRSSCPTHIRDQLTANRLAMSDALRMLSSIQSGVLYVQAQANRNLVDAVHGLHDIKTGVSLVMRNAEAITSSLPGDSDDERIENASPPMKALLKSVQLMYRRVSMPAIITNPASARFGQKHPTPVYRVFHRMVKLFEQLAARAHVRLHMLGVSKNAPLCYDSFENLALVLLDNAVKYSLENRIVTVRVDDVPNFGVHVEVSSWGSPVPEDLRRDIFLPTVRAPAAKMIASAGSGLGLAIAQIVARAHESSVQYDCRELSKDGKIGLNVFSFTLTRG